MAFEDQNDANALQGSSEDQGYAECEAKIDALEQRVAAIEAKLGIQKPADSDDQSPRSDNPFSDVKGGY